MSTFDFGRIGEALSAAAKANINRNTTPVYFGTGTFDVVLGSTVDALQNNQLVYGVPNEFVWAVHKWDDGENEVV